MVVYAFNPGFGRQRQEDLCEIETSMVYIKKNSRARLHKETLYWVRGYPRIGAHLLRREGKGGGGRIMGEGDLEVGSEWNVN